MSAVPVPGATQGQESSDVLVIGVCGGSGSGKSTVSEKLVAGIGDSQLAYVCHDWYYRDQSHVPDIEVRAKSNYDHPNALETELLVEHVKQLKKMVDIHVPDYNFAEHTRFGGMGWRDTHARVVTAAPIVLVEGILLFENAELRELIDIRVFVDADADLRFIRRMMRDIAPASEGGRGRHVADVVRQFTTTVRPMHNLFVEPMKKHAHIVLPMNEPNETADKLMLAVVIQRVEEVKLAYLEGVRSDGMSGGGEVVGA
jgi:uridine kinase